MTYYEWKKIIINNYQKDKEADMRQFGIQSIDVSTELGRNLICSNIFGTNSNSSLFKLLNTNEKVAIIVGFGGNNDLHLGHLLLSQEINFYLKNVKHPKFYFVNFDSDNDIDFVEQMKQLNVESEFNMIYEIIDYKNIEALKLKRKIAKFLNVNTVNRVMGWNNEDMQAYEKMLDMLTTFSLGCILQEECSIILTDINQKTYYALYKHVENKINNRDACFVYHLLMPSLKSPLERMSIKNPKSLIYLNENIQEIENKLKKSYSGTDNKENTCSILRVADLVLSSDETMNIVNNCINNFNCCNACKISNIERISNEIVKRKTLK